MTTNRDFYMFGQFLVNIYSRQNDGKFLSKEDYLSYVRTTIKILNVSEQRFLNAELKQLKAWFRQIEDKRGFHNLNDDYKSDLKSGFNAFINFGRYQAGFVNY